MYEIAIVYVLMSLLYYAQRRIVFLRKNEVLVFSRHTSNARVERGAASLMVVSNTRIASRKPLRTTLRFSLDVIRPVRMRVNGEPTELAFALDVKADVTHANADHFAGDPVEKSAAELGNSLCHYIENCELPYFYYIFDRSGRVIPAISAFCHNTTIHALRVNIIGVAIHEKQESAPEQEDVATDTAPIPQDCMMREAYLRAQPQSPALSDLAADDNSTENDV